MVKVNDRFKKKTFKQKLNDSHRLQTSKLMVAF